MKAFEDTIEVTSWYPGPFGGGVVVGRNRSGHILKILLPAAITGRDPRIAETWNITGRGDGERATARTAKPLMPAGDAIVRWIASNPNLPGIGRVKATKIWKAHRADLYRILLESRVAVLAETVPVSIAEAVVREFAQLRDEISILEAYNRVGITAKAAAAACRLWGAEAKTKLDDDPYCMTALEKWSAVDGRALRSGIAPQDDRRLLAAVAEVMSARFRARDINIAGHTAATRQEVEAGTAKLLGGEYGLAERAFTMACRDGVLIERADLYQARATWRMERDIELAVKTRIREAGQSDRPAIARALRAVTSETGLELSTEQRDAVEMAVSAGCAVIDGAAGTGKSAVTRAIRAYADEVGVDYVQIALSGRAAKRLAEATGRGAMTVHRFLKAMANGKLKIGKGFLLIDEISMLGIPDLWQVLSWTPIETNVVLVGDPGQLPPITAGNPLAALVSSRTVPRRTLRVIRRQASDSLVPAIAAEIRAGRCPRIPAFDAQHAATPGVHLVKCDTSDVPVRLLGVYEALVGSPTDMPDLAALRRHHAARVQILGATRHGPAGVTALSEAIENRWMAAQAPVHDWGLAHGSKILWTKNSYDHRTGRSDENGDEVLVDIMNGSLGIVQRSTRNGAVVLFDDVENSKVEVLRPDLDRIVRGWAITTHKAQGSAFETVIIPITPSRLLDRLLLYTAVTRARTSVILVGDEQLLASSIAAEPRSSERRQCLDFDR